MLFDSVKVSKMVGQMPFSLQSNKTLILITLYSSTLYFSRNCLKLHWFAKELQAKPVKAKRERPNHILSSTHVCIRVATINTSHLLSTSNQIGSTLHRLSKSKIKQEIKEIYKLQSQKFPFNIRSWSTVVDRIKIVVIHRAQSFHKASPCIILLHSILPHLCSHFLAGFVL